MHDAHDPVIRFWLKQMKRAFTLILLALATAACFTAAPPTKAKKASTPGTKVVQKASARSAGNRTATSHNSSATTAKVRYVRSRRGKLVRVVAHQPPPPSYQLHPDPERYQQIQQALADRGYFKGEVNGQWGDDSVDALKRFQADQKLDDDGHLTALTLIGLGLGPKHDHDLSVPANVVTPNVPNNSAPKSGSSTEMTPVINTAKPAGSPPPGPSATR